jgi:hypothetical protein
MAMNGFKRYTGIVIILASCDLSTTVAAQENAPVFNTELNAGIEMFRWQEFDDNGSRLLTEFGPRLFFLAEINNADKSRNGFVYEATLKGYTGNVDYDGQDSNKIFISSKTMYSGFGLEFNGGYRIMDEIDMDILAGLGLNLWRREIMDEQNAQGSLVSGIIEDYNVQYLTLAIGLPQRFANVDGYLKVGLKRPFSIDEDVDGFGVRLSPAKKTSGLISYKLTFAAIENGKSLISSILFYYDSFRFGRSDDKVSVINGIPVQVHQPKSNQDVVGVAIGHIF